MAMTGTSAPPEPDDLLGAMPLGDRPVRDRSMPADAERLLREWFSSPDAGLDVDTGSPTGPARSVVADQAEPVTAGPAAGPPGDLRRAAWSPPLRDLVDAVAAVRAQEPVDLPGPRAVAEAEVLLQQLEVLRSVVLARIADVDLRSLHAFADAASTSSWLDAQQTSLSRGEVAFARRLAAFPAVSAAVEDGTLSVAGAGRIAAALLP